MKPNFALSLSFKGIRLLYRAVGGWREIGEVSVSSPDLADELAMLRKTAVGLEPAGVRSKLIIPDSQIKYLTLDTPGLPEAARRTEAESALAQATPYDVADLAYDINVDGPRTHVAAVARETLKEAEAFAQEHRFHPVSFVGAPGDEAFPGEPFFGKTESAATLLEPGDQVEPDDVAVVVLGTAAAPRPEAQPSTSQDKPTDPVEEDSRPDPEPTPASDPQPPASDPPVAQSDAADPSPPTSNDTPDPQIDLPTAPPPPSKPTLSASKTVSGSAQAAPSTGFASQRRADTAPGPVTAKALGGATRAPASPPEPDSSSLTPAPVAAEPASAAGSPPRASPSGKISFLSRRKPRKGAAAPVPAPSIAVPAAGTEQERLTVFGARTDQVGGKPRFLGLIMTVILLIFLAAVAAWAAIFLDEGLTGLLRRDDDRAIASAPENQIAPQIIRIPVPQDSTATDEAARTAALDPVLSAEDTAMLDALQAPRPIPERPVITEQEAAARYAVTGIWPLAPTALPERPDVASDAAYLTEIDPISAASDAIAIPRAKEFETDRMMAGVVNPPPFGQRAGRDAEGLLIPTTDGIVTPGGYTLFAASPPIKPPAVLTRFASRPTIDPNIAILAAVRPQARPGDLADSAERAQLGGFTISELAAFRPALRPRALQERARAEAAARAATAAATIALEQPSDDVPTLESATKYAVALSRRPDPRPANFASVVERAERTRPQEETRVAAAASVAPRTVAPNIPSTASVTRSATTKNAINLRRVNLIGIYGKPSSRRALVRLANGRYKKVRVGDRIDGGQVLAISETDLRYSKNGRSVVLKMPKG